ncbi:uncharacterized protein TNCV_1158481 [Trichonephila clavipes]|nr:uncharacterized protein TNCV_1158481 [Trichonephila clavipes]
MAALVSEYTLEFFTLLNARGKKELIEWCMKEGLIASSYECPKCNEQMGLNERKSVVLDGFEWRCRKKEEIGVGVWTRGTPYVRHCHELVTSVVSVESKVQILVPLKICRVDWLMHIKSVEVQTPHVDVKQERGSLENVVPAQMSSSSLTCE